MTFVGTHLLKKSRFDSIVFVFLEENFLVFENLTGLYFWRVS